MRAPGIALVAAICAGCAQEEQLSPLDRPIEADLSVDIRGTGALRIEGPAPGNVGVDTRVVLSLSDGYGVAPAGAALSAPGRAEPFPEAAATLYTARFSVAADPSGPCGSTPVSLALSLHRSGGGDALGGALTAYCGENVFHGVPARVLRLSGRLRR